MKQHNPAAHSLRPMRQHETLLEEVPTTLPQREYSHQSVRRAIPAGPVTVGIAVTAAAAGQNERVMQETRMTCFPHDAQHQLTHLYIEKQSFVNSSFLLNIRTVHIRMYFIIIEIINKL
jgi:hypothetical protein